MWNDANYISFDFETSGTLPEYALQPWRVAQGKAWATSLATVRKIPDNLVIDGGLLVGQTYEQIQATIRRFLNYAVDHGLTVVGWNTAFDISWCIAYGCEDLVDKLKWLDGMLLWKHLTVEPEYEMTRGKKKSYRLKLAVTEFLPQFAGYEEDIDFHAIDAVSLLKLQAYNERDTMFTLRLARQFYNELYTSSPQRLRAALIEADCLPMVAKANLSGMLVDTEAASALGDRLVHVADDMLTRLAPYGVTEKVVRSPKQLSKLLFEDWGLPVLKQNTSKLTGNTTDSTDKEVLHELAFIDPRAAQIRAYREALGNKTKFVDAPLQSVAYNENARTHPGAIVFGTYCVPGDVEVLTRNGWQRLDAWHGGEIAQVRDDLTIEFLPADRFVGPMTHTWVHMRQRGFDCMFTPGHTVAYLKQKTFKWTTTTAGTMVGSGEAKYVPTAGRAVLSGQYTPDQMRLFAAVQADGCSTPKELKFTLKKIRKIERLRKLLAACDVAHREYVCAAYPDRVEFHIPRRSRPNWLGHDKKHFAPWVLDTTQEGLSALVDELEHWDGSPHVDGGFRYVSAIEANVVWATTAAALVGRKASTHRRSPTGMYSCHVSEAATRACKTIKPARDVTTVQRSARAYCTTTATGFWLARSNGHIFVTGNSGRMTYASKQGKNKDERQTGFALHQEKRGKDFRSIIVAPPGYTLMEFDAAGQEFRWMAIAAEDDTMLEMCLPGEDPHGYMGAQIQRLDYRELVAQVREGVKEAKDARQLGKVANLGCQYRTSAKKLRVVARVQYNIPMELPEAEVIHRTYQQSYRNVPLFWRRQIELTKRLGYVETFAGRRVQVAGNWRGTQGWSMESTSINYRIQGCLQVGVRVRTDAGEIPIQELVGATFRVWTGHKWASATAVNRGACQLAEVHLDTGEIIRCDTRHKLKTDDRTWLEFNQITPGVRIALPRLRELLQPSAEITWPFVLGYWLGDGWMGETRRGSKGFRRDIQFYGGREKLPTLQRMQRFFAEQGHTTYLRANARGVWSVSSYRKGLLQEMQRRGVPLGSRARTKRVPETVWRMPEQERRDFWAGVEASDGVKGKGQEGNVHTPNLSLVQDLQNLLSSIGGASWVVPTKNAWLLRVLRHDGGVYPKDVLLRDLGGFVPPCRMGDCASIVDRRAATGKQAVTQRVAERIYDRWLPQHEVYRYSTVKDVRVLGRAEDTFTLSVDDPLHQFVADGVVHKNTGADQKYLALSVLRPYITRIGAVFAWELHDGIYLYVPDAMVERAAVEIPYLLANLPYRKAWGFTPPIPLPWDCKFGPSWGMLKEWDNG